MKLFYYIRRFWEIPGVERVLLIKAFGILILLTPMTNLVPLRYFYFLLRASPKFRLSVYQNKQFIRIIRKTLHRIDRFSPVRLSCLTKSMTFKLLLNNYGVQSKIVLGINYSHPRNFKAHAHVEIDGFIIYLKNEKFKKVCSFN